MNTTRKPHPHPDLYDTVLDASWEIDLFDSLRQQRESAQATAQMNEAAAMALRTSFDAETTRLRYEHGDASLADALNVERELADQQATLALLRASAASEMVTLYEALGGGWDSPTAPKP